MILKILAVLIIIPVGIGIYKKFILDTFFNIYDINKKDDEN